AATIYLAVPLAVLSDKNYEIKEGGSLKDIAPSVLSVMEPEKKEEIKEKFNGEIIIYEKSAVFD
ncbi:MAG: hypothetical protein ACQESB_07515, partial [Elusimicrobiota bacterium]